MSLSVNLGTPSQNRFSSQKTAARDPNRPLHIEIVDPKDYPKIAEIGQEWAEIAKKKMAQTIRRDWAAYEQFDSSLCITGEMKSLTPKCLGENDRVFVCKDLEGNIHGFAQAKFSTNMISGSVLCTNPINIRCKANESEVERVENVGLTFLKFAAELMKKENKPITGFTLTSADSFYAKYGFQNGRFLNDIIKLPQSSAPTSKL